MGKRVTSRGGSPKPVEAITGLFVEGYKSICDPLEIEIRPLTILAGANSSGKSSMMQPLLLLKQTLEASYDPGALLLSGPNVRFTAAHQFLTRIRETEEPKPLRVGVRDADHELVVTTFLKERKRSLDVVETYAQPSVGQSRKLTRGMDGEAVLCMLSDTERRALDTLTKTMQHLSTDAGHLLSHEKPTGSCGRTRCFLRGWVGPKSEYPLFFLELATSAERLIRGVIHLPGLRGNPERTYPVTAVGGAFPGRFDHYVASIVAHWEKRSDPRLDALSADLKRLHLTWKVAARSISDTEVELSVGRLGHAARGGAHDLVSIADVGFGVSQVLPLVVALHAARPGQLVYIEQPELHLHPRAQVALAEVLADAAKRGVRVVAETHSATLVLAVQTLVAEGQLDGGLVKLHWFQRSPKGATTVKSADLDGNGAFGDWPEDFAEVAMKAEARYLDAVERHHGG